jgi:hypothetical protein
MRAPNSYWFLSMVGAAVITFAVPAAYAVRVQGFESGDPAVNGFGDAGTQLTYQGEAPTDPTHWYLITTVRTTDLEDGVTPQSGNNALPFATLNDAAHFNGAAPVGVDGSGVFIPFTVNPGDTTLTFDYDFLSNEPGQTTPRNDFSFAAFFTTSGTVIAGTSTTFANISSATLLFGGGSPFAFHSGVQTLSMNVSGLAPGNYLLGIGIEDATNGNHASGLLIDNVQITAVPEPTTIAFSIAGGALLVALRSRIKRRS